MNPLSPPHSWAISTGKDAYPSYRRCAAKLKDLPWRVAAPSFVLPAGAAENCRFLDGLVPEVALLFLETRACLEYGPEDLPAWLADLGLAFHVHLPLDLPWDQGAGPALDAVLALAAKAAHLHPRAFVLHPPPDLGLLPAVAGRWRAGGPAAPLLLENTARHGPTALAGPAAASGLGLCLDLGHTLAYLQDFPARDLDFSRVGMLHLSAPGQGDEHLPLDLLPERGRRMLREWLERLPATAALTVEVFNVEGLLRSLDCLADWIAAWGLER